MRPLKAAIGLGSNIGDRIGHLRGAASGLRELGELVAVSPLYETAPVGDVPQGPYLNAVAVLDTAHAPLALLAALLEIERASGRERRVRCAPPSARHSPRWSGAPRRRREMRSSPAERDVRRGGASGSPGRVPELATEVVSI